MPQPNEFEAFTGQNKTRIDAFLSEKLDRSVSDERLKEAMSYSVNAGGKRLRPLLTLATLKTLKVPVTTARLQAATALELLHTYSLIHDDLPAMDNDRLRRGQATNHVKYGAGLATLAGDGLLTLTFEWVATAQLPVNQRLALMTELSQAAGPTGMVAGQAMDVENTQQRLDFQALQALHRQKTGALIRYALLAGGIMGQASKAILQRLKQFGDAYGLAFQIYDDLMDVLGSEERMGKSVRKDAPEQKNTYPGLLGIEETIKRLKLTLQEARNAMETLYQVDHIDGALLVSFLDYFKLED